MDEDTKMGLRCVGLAFIIVGHLMLQASTYDCQMREDIGVRGCILIGSLTVGLSWWLLGFVSGRPTIVRPVTAKDGK